MSDAHDDAVATKTSVWKPRNVAFDGNFYKGMKKDKKEGEEGGEAPAAEAKK